VNFYLNGEGHNPTLATVEKLLRAIGGDIARALPRDADGETLHINGESMPVYGSVSAGRVDLAVEEVENIDAPSTLWRDSVYRALTTGPVHYLRVRGDSMEPDFPDGSLIACARPNTAQLPDLTPVILRHADDVTFKLFQRAGKDVLAVPLNRSHPVQQFRLRDISVDYIVLGTVTPYRQGTSASRRILRDNG
jgi:SOS-response transcriptional repressor LexA